MVSAQCGLGQLPGEGLAQLQEMASFQPSPLARPCTPAVTHLALPTEAALAISKPDSHSCSRHISPKLEMSLRVCFLLQSLLKCPFYGSLP